MKKGLSGKVSLFLVIILVFTVAASGCINRASGNDEYVEKVSAFYDKIQNYDKKITSIDPKSKEAATELLTTLDSMNKDFQEFGELDPPKQIPDAKEHALNAAKLMDTAVTYYHQALDGDDTDTDALANAKLNYSNAIIEVKNVGIAMQNSGLK